jgi:hypothetical protein
MVEQLEMKMVRRNFKLNNVHLDQMEVREVEHLDDHLWVVEID